MTEPSGTPPVWGAPRHQQPPSGGHGGPPHAGWGAYGPGAYGYAPPLRPRNGMGTTSVILSIFGLLLCWFLGAGVLLGILGVIFGVIGLRRAQRGEATNRGTAITGIVLSAFAVVVSTVLLAVLGTLLGKVSECTDRTRYPTQQDRQACVENRLEQEVPPGGSGSR